MIIYGKQLFLHLLEHYPSKLQTVFFVQKMRSETFFTHCQSDIKNL